jgi:hypothetical protein
MEGLRVGVKVKQYLRRRKRRIPSRLHKTKRADLAPVFSNANIHYEVSVRARTIAAGEIGMIHDSVRQPGLHGNRFVGMEPQDMVCPAHA